MLKRLRRQDADLLARNATTNHLGDCKNIVMNSEMLQQQVVFDLMKLLFSCMCISVTLVKVTYSQKGSEKNQIICGIAKIYQ